MPRRRAHQKAGRNLDKGAGIGLLLASGNSWSDLDNRLGCSGLNFFIGWEGMYIARDALLRGLGGVTTADWLPLPHVWKGRTLPGAIEKMAED